MTNSRRITKSPVPEPSLPLPGESGQLQMDDYWGRRVLGPVVAASITFALAAAEWARRLVGQWPSAWFFTITFVLLSAFCAWRVLEAKREMKRRHQGVRGERIVGQMLEDLRYFGCKVYHDICEDDYNIDHVIIGPHGVFAVETKAISKPEGDARVVFDGEEVAVAGFKPDRDPVAQARACARRIREILKEYSGADARVRPVVLYVGWFVENLVRNPDVIVMNPTHFLQAFDRLSDPETLDDQQVQHLANNFERYLRGKE